MKAHKVTAELRKIEAKHGGILRPVDVVAAAKSNKSPLHSCFEWDDSAAGHQYRIWQARQLIRVSVEILPQSNTTERVFVSLSSDRHQPDGGYRNLTSVMSNADMQEILLADALAEFEIFERKYQELKALAPLFLAVKQVRKRTRRKLAV